jgi:succinate dehydrogenase/fumarate reductase flavoprotein subunit
MSFLPVPADDGLGPTSRQLVKARRAQANSELELFRYGLIARTRAEMDRLDSQAIADASRAALEEEMDLLDYGLARAGTSAAKIELVARHVNRMAIIDDRRITRRFGG